LFRSLKPTNSPVRYFPNLASVLANANWDQEKLPTTSRTNKFRLTVRDNRSGGGGVADAGMTVRSVAGTGPFMVTSPNLPTNWVGQQTVTWSVAGTAVSPINCSGVNLYLSTNGGLTFPFLLATNAANTGAANVALPNLTANDTARIMVAGAGNIFYDISDANFSISSYAPPVITSTAVTNSAIFFSWATQSGLRYQVQSRTNLGLGTWLDFGPPFVGTGGVLTTNNLIVSEAARFYRVVVGP
jgi:hypothetical protein